MNQTDYDVVIIGGGPAGMTAGLYASRAELKTLLVEKMILGGQVMTTTTIENWPGYPGGVDGPELMMKFQEHCVEFGLETTTGSVDKIEDQGKTKRVVVDGKEIICSVVIIATGVIPKKMGLPGEQELVGRGVSYCATCDGAFFRNLPIAVIGGGDTAGEEALFLRRFASKLTMVHRRDKLRATKIVASRILADEKIEMAWDSVVDSLVSDQTGLTGMVLRNLKTDELTEVEVAGLFVAVGVVPTTDFVADILDLDENGYIIAGENTHTNVPGIYAAGDCRTNLLMQISTAVGDGAVAALMAERHIDELQQEA